MNNKDNNTGITRRDLLQSLALAVSVPGLLTAQTGAAQAGAGAGTPDITGTIAGEIQNTADYYPPIKTGLRGTHVGAYEAAHMLRDGEQPIPIEDSGLHYDLVIVGGGISGLSAAWMYRQQRPTARILILDNHDDFGGHAKRNEFHINGELHLMNGGTLSIQSPRPYSTVADGVLRSLGINSQELNTRIQKKSFYPEHGLVRGFYFDQATFGRDAVIRHAAGTPWKSALANAPLSQQARKDIIRIEEAHTDYLPGLSSAQKKEKLSSISYLDFLTNIVKADPDAIRFYQQRTHGEFCIGIDAVSAMDCWGLGLPGFQGLALEHGSIPRMGPTCAGFADTGGSVDVHLPDGGATIARALVRGLIPDAVPGKTVDDLITAKVDYAKLDRPEADVQIRLNSIVVSATNVDGKVAVEYLNGGHGYAVHATQCVLACWNMVIPYLCPDLPAEQKAALKSLVKAPLVYCSVAIKNWNAFKKLGVAHIHSPGAFFADVWLNEWLSVGKYHTPRTPDQPIVVHMVYTPCEPGQNGTEQLRIGRAKILATSLEMFEAQIRQQLDSMLGKAGFNSTEDIIAMTVNRWPHGYAYEYDPMLGPPSAPGSEPYVIGRQRFGAIAIANSDSGGLAYMDSAIDQAHRAVHELLELPGTK
jgi:spermidine dehydrogenase